MMEEQINNLIARMIDLGYEYDQDNKDGVYFNFMDGTNGHLTISDWDEVKSFCDNHEKK